MTGVLKTWKEDRGFGFITPDNGGRDVFIHISSMGEVTRRPIPGDIIHYQVARDRNGKFRAINATIDGVSAANSTGKAESSSGWVVALIIGLLLAAGAVYFYLHSEGVV